MSRVYNFSAGPAVLPEEVLKEAAAEMLDSRWASQVGRRAHELAAMMRTGRWPDNKENAA